MKRPLLLLAMVLLFPFASFSQQLSFDHLVTLMTKDIDDINDFLVASGWEYTGPDAKYKDELKRVNWVFNPSVSGELATAWFSVYSDSNDKRLGFGFTTHSSDQFELIKKQAISIGMTKHNSGIEENGAIYSVLVGAKYVLRFVASKGGKNVVYLHTKASYFSDK